MKSIFTLICLTTFLFSKAQVLCGTAPEGGSVTLTAPVGNVFIGIEFASYGTPNGSCGSFTLGPCHALNSLVICEAAFLGQNSATISATNGVFGDPCGGTVKRLYVQARYSATLPLRLNSFTAQKVDPLKVKLEWSSDHEINTSHFVIERSIDGALFEPAGSVAATGQGGHYYSFTSEILSTVSTYFYRLKMVDIDGKYQYSNIVRINNNLVAIKLSLFPSPANKYITVISSTQQHAVIANSTGQIIKKISLISGNQTLNIAGWNRGIYFIKSEAGVMKFIKE